ncbi:MAG: selenide, water dikinase SelD [Bacteroidales bacterium]|jgi:cysteine desulfurase NifS/selenium donor protein|nr:selenide, water dikinase SelD [Bacteroidales bacterium]MBP9589324.1 selenide, water dikinase SelD [Bacteroidales bacterium]
MNLIYLDYNATTPLATEVIEAMKPFMEVYFGNPSSAYVLGQKTRLAVEEARRQVSTLLGCQPDEVIFTSGGTESNNMAIKGAALANRSKGNHIITSCIEHPSVLEVCHWLESHGFRITYLPVDEFGRVDLDAFRAAISEETIIVSIMHSNNETGSLQPVQEIGMIAKQHGILFHVDAAQSIGKIPVKVDDFCVDLLSVAGHKFYAPKGIGALYIRRGVKIEKIIHGASQEFGWRPGTENVIHIAGLGMACKLVNERLENDHVHLKSLRDRLQAGLFQRIDGVKLNGHPELRLPNTLNVSIAGIEANALISELSDIAVSTGAACHSQKQEASHVLEAMHLSPEFAMGTLRFSLGRYTTEDEIDRAVEEIILTVKRLRRENPPLWVCRETDIKLTHFTQGLGCACKLQPAVLEEVIKKIPLLISSPNLLVGYETSDDACVYKTDENLALVSALDFFTPIVDDPYQFGAIATANSLSDIYAMGAKPLFALNIVAFPSHRLPLAVLENILKGATDKAAEAGIPIMGGHTIDDAELKFGLAVTGTIHPNKIMRNCGAKPGDRIILTKPIGSGILSTALKQGLLQKSTEEIFLKNLLTLNKKASEIMLSFPVTACTDVTGFGLLGHLMEMCKPGHLGAILYRRAIPLFLFSAMQHPKNFYKQFGTVRPAPHPC